MCCKMKCKWAQMRDATGFTICSVPQRDEESLEVGCDFDFL